MSYIAVLSSPIVKFTGNASVRLLSGDEIKELNLAGVNHYCGHPDTRKLIEHFGATKADGMYDFDLKIGEKYLAFPLQNPRKNAEWTVDQAVSSMEELEIFEITRTA